jgi:hypothetical protein
MSILCEGGGGGSSNSSTETFSASKFWYNR